MPEQRVRVHFYPKYSDVRHLLRVLSGRPKKEMTGLRAAILAGAGNPKNRTNYQNPDEWIPTRLQGKSQELAHAIWIESGNTFNPAQTGGPWGFVQKYKLVIADPGGLLQLTPAGKDFVEQSPGDTETHIDHREGVLEVLALVAGNTPTRSKQILKEWSDYLARFETPMRAEVTKRESLRERLTNLIDRGFVERRNVTYSVTGDGLAYLKRSTDDLRQVQTLLMKRETSVRKKLRKVLHEMDPKKFEHLIARLLEEMGYENVEVVGKAGDGGVDVEADIQVGITWVHEVVQAKRYKYSVPIKEIAALRGSLYQFNAIRGTIITTSKFSKAAQEAAFAPGAAPITLVDGDKLVDLLIENGIGARKRTLSALDLRLEDFDALGMDYGDQEEEVGY